MEVKKHGFPFILTCLPLNTLWEMYLRRFGSRTVMMV